MNPERDTFVWHLEQLRKHLLRVLIVMLLLFIVAFMFGKPLFTFLVIAPMQTDFYFFRIMCQAGRMLGYEGFCGLTNNMQLINIEMAGQFIAQVKTAILITMLVALPYVLVETWAFISPALYDHEKKLLRQFMWLSAVLFYSGVLFGWFVLMPLSVLFLGNYQLDQQIINMIHIDSYTTFFILIVAGTGLMFLIPLMLYGLVRVNIIHVHEIRRFRKHVIVGIVIIMAILSPTTDALSLLLMSLPLIILFEGTLLFLQCYAKKNKHI